MTDEQRGEGEMSEELLPCPFCGGEAVVKEINTSHNINQCWVRCGLCEAETRFQLSKKIAVEKWNTRVGVEKKIIQE